VQLDVRSARWRRTGCNTPPLDVLEKEQHVGEVLVEDGSGAVS